jgi:exodeoxyribonuclease VII large subunit
MNQFSLFTPSVWTVSNITRYLRELLDSDETLQDIWVQGEISNLSRPVSGHIYFTLKDNTSSLRCVMWRSAALRMLSMPRDGEAVEVHGNFSIYEAGGQYQLYADTIRSLGEGALYQEFLRLKARLEAEGLFDPARKRPLPRRPQRIAIVTSSTGAALRDILNTLRRRYPLAAVFISPTPVQGSEAPPGIIAALEAAVRVADPDVIIVARGGGSMEDLWAFNDEAVARAIAACPVPVISGVGHETDFTIADFVSDLRAPTPTAAAELATPNQADLAADLQGGVDRLARSTQQIIEKYRWQLHQAEGKLRQNSPRTRLFSDRQRLDDLQHRAALALRHNLVLLRAHLVSHQQRLNALNPSQVLQRGYAILHSADGSTIKSITQVIPGDFVVASLSDGDLGLIVKETIPQPSQAENHG